jgi:hypothetical protein
MTLLLNTESSADFETRSLYCAKKATISLALECNLTDWRERRYKLLNYVYALILGVTFPKQLFRSHVHCLQ